jgi:hypothetical protein
VWQTAAFFVLNLMGRGTVGGGGVDHHRFSKMDSETRDLCSGVVTEATKTCYIEMNWQQQLKFCVRSNIRCEEIVACCRMASNAFISEFYRCFKEVSA